tara:strand:+ start:112 stop:1008 length:897 start_codon:yes stop_codon:yes gene_type:complete
MSNLQNEKIPVIGVPIVNGLHWLERLVESIDYPVENLIIINNSGDKLFKTNLEHKVKAWSEKENLIDEIHLLNFPSNMGVPFAWNCIIKSFLLKPYWIICNHDIAFTPGLLSEMHNEAQIPSVGMVHPCRGNYTQGSFDLFLIKENVIQEIGLFDENFYPAYGEDVDYIMRILNSNIIRTCGLSKIHLHGEKPAGDVSLGSFTGTMNDYVNSKPIEEINKENYDHNYEENGGQSKRENPKIGEKLETVNHHNYYYQTQKWGEHWRGTCPTEHPMNNPNLPQSYTTFDLDFVRKKHLGF